MYLHDTNILASLDPLCLAQNGFDEAGIYENGKTCCQMITELIPTWMTNLRNDVLTKSEFQKQVNRMLNEKVPIEQQNFAFDTDSKLHVLTYIWGSGVPYCSLYIFRERSDYCRLVYTCNIWSCLDVKAARVKNLITFTGVLLGNKNRETICTIDTKFLP